jgi:hypothetical protein
MRIVKEKAAHKIDAIIAMAMAVCGAVGQAGGAPGILDYYRRLKEKRDEEERRILG